MNGKYDLGGWTIWW